MPEDYTPQAQVDSPNVGKVVKFFMHHGVNKVRLTGGEPLVYPGLEDLVGQIGGLGKKLGNPMADFPNAPTSIFKVLQDESAIIEALWQTT